VYLLDRGFNVAMISYRGHSGNPGKANQKFIINDLISAIKEILNLGYKVEDVFLEGSSLGTAGLAHALKRIYQESEVKSRFGGLVLLGLVILKLCLDSKNLRFFSYFLCVAQSTHRLCPWNY